MKANTQRIYDRPDRESARLASLAEYAIINSAAEAAFDAIARLAAQICDVPFALISLVDERRLWIKSSVGLDVDELPREHTPCNTVVTSGEPLYLSDASQHSRFCSLPVVTGAPGLRFYAGTPLTVDRALCDLSHCSREELLATDIQSLTHPEDLAADLLLIDVMMPATDGPATLAALSQVLAVNGLPVVCMTAKSQPDDHRNYYALGVAAVIVKPFDPMTLAARIKIIWEEFHA